VRGVDGQRRFVLLVLGEDIVVAAHGDLGVTAMDSGRRRRYGEHEACATQAREGRDADRAPGWTGPP
jgi:hypothetical protein